MEPDSVPLYILVDDSRYTINMNEYWTIVHSLLFKLADNKLKFNLIRLNFKYRNFTESVTNRERATYLLNMSPRGENPICSKLKDIFYSLNGKGSSKIIVLSPKIEESPTLVYNLRTFLPDQSYVNFVITGSDCIPSGLSRIRRVKTIQLNYSRFKALGNDGIYDNILGIKLHKPKSVTMCCCIC